MHIIADRVTTFMQNMRYVVVEPDVPHSWFNSSAENTDVHSEVINIATNRVHMSCRSSSGNCSSSNSKSSECDHITCDTVICTQPSTSILLLTHNKALDKIKSNFIS